MVQIQSDLSHHEETIDVTTKKLLNDELFDTIKKFDLLQYQHLAQMGIWNPISTWLGFNTENVGLIVQFDEIEQDEENEVTVDNNIDDDFEIDADEEEIMEIENMRCIDDDSDNEDYGNPDKNRQPICLRRPIIPIDDAQTMDGFQIQRHQKKLQKNRIRQELKKTEQMTIDEAKAVRDIWNLSQNEKWNLYRFWRTLYVQKIEERIREQRRKYKNEWVRFNALRNQEDLEIVQGSFIIGMTTTGAAKYRHIIDGIKPRIIIVEEAAEVLEAHIITSLCTKTDHLILIGDHQQLKPNPAVYELAKKFKLEVSLFERMIQNGIVCHQLKLQHRMRPSISELLVPHIYKELMDHDSVKEYEDIKGVSSNMFFVNHDEKESKVNETMSRKNNYEAHFVVELCRYLILQGYETSQVTILTMYSGQLYQIKSLIKSYDILKGVRATVVDNFQGEENEIIILTFVRSNYEGDIGFLKVSNRVNVALSRAKKGLYCIGNFDCLAEKSHLWQQIVGKLKQQGAIGSSLELYCQNHPQTLTFITKGSDFLQSPEGGCSKPCDARLLCGHVCQSICHIYDSKHELMKCHKPCDKVLCESQHRCKKKCHLGKDCGNCTVLVKKLRTSCGHWLKVKCSESPENVFCDNPCDKIKICSHKCQLKCGNNCESNPCSTIVEVQGTCNHMVKVRCCDQEDTKVRFSVCDSPCSTLLDCGHKCLGTCGQCYRGRLHIKCKAKCYRPLVCGHLCNEICATNCPPCTKLCQNMCLHSQCKMKCGNPCASCQEPCQWSCEHEKCSRLCKENCDRDVCITPCKKLLTCDHPCIGFCGEPCPQLCRICDKDKVQEIFFGDEDEPDARFILLIDCNHIVEAKGLMNWMKEQREESPNNSGNIIIQMKACPKCKTVIRRTKALNLFIQSSLRDLEAVKTRIFGNIEDNRMEQVLLYAAITNHDINDINLDYVKHTSQIRSVYEQLLKNTKLNENQLIGLSVGDIKKYANIYNTWTNIVEALKAFSLARRGSQKNISAVVIDELEQRAAQLLSFMKKFSNNKQEIEDVQTEITLLQISSAAAKHVNVTTFSDGGPQIIQNAFESILNSRFTEIVKNNFVLMLKEANKLQSGIGIPLEEKNMILSVMGFSKGHWFKCPNGHIYCIGECGRAMQKSKCPECGSRIGGTQHRLLRDNALATEMDGARAPSWPRN